MDTADELARLKIKVAELEDELEQRNSLIARCEIIYQKSPLAYQSLDENGCFIDVNPRWLEVLGYDRAEVLGKFFGDFLHPDQRPLFRKRFAAFKKSGRVSNVEFQICCRDGTYKSVSFEGCAAQREDGSFLQTHCVFQDITARKDLERDLKFMLAATNDGIWVYNLKTNAFSHSDRWAEMLGYESGDVSDFGCFCKDNLHPEDKWRFEKAFTDYLEGRSSSYDIEFRLRCADGRYKWIYSRGLIVKRDDHGRPERIIGAHTDIDQRKRNELSILDAQQKLSSVFRSAPSGIGVVVNRKFIELNDRFCEMLGYRREELLGRNSRMLYPSDTEYQKVGKDKYGQIKKSGIGTVETQMLRKDGTTVDILLSSCPIDPGDWGKGVTFAAQDITETVRAKRQLHNQAESLEDIFNASPTILMVVNGSGRIEKINRAGQRFAQKSAEGVVGALIGEVFDCVLAINSGCGLSPGCSQCPIRTKVETTLATGAAFQDEESALTLKTRNGDKPFNLLVSAAPVDIMDERKVLVSVNDITKQRLSEAKQAAMEKQLHHAQKMESLGVLAGGIAHDFNNVLTPIIGMADLLTEDLIPGTIQYKNAKEIVVAGERAAKLVKQILAFSRQSEEKFLPVGIQSILKEALKLCRSTIPSDITISQHIDARCGLVLANPTHIHQIAMNLITNAFHAMEETGGTIDVTLAEEELTEEKVGDRRIVPGRYAVFTCTDTGHGIPPEVIEKVFEPYFTTKEKGKGTGLGLSVVYGIVKEYGGDIQINSISGKGTSVEVLLPVISDTPDEIIPQEAAAALTGSEHILLVDDEQALLEMVRQMLERLGYRVTKRTSSVEALEAFNANPEIFDLVITDMTMPNLTGDKLSIEIRATRPDMPIIICTGFSERINDEIAASLGINGLLRKPIIKSDLAKMVRNALEHVETAQTQL